MEMILDFPQKIKIDLQYDLVIPPLGQLAQKIPGQYTTELHRHQWYCDTSNNI